MSRRQGNLNESYERNYAYRTSASGSLALPSRHFASPQKVGSRIWGSQTSLYDKGRPPKLNNMTWCCAVCLYVENPKDSQLCVICQSPNYSISKV